MSIHYEFPKIYEVGDVLSVVGNDPNFMVRVPTDIYGHTSVTYLTNGLDTFPDVVTNSDAIRRECRGIKFDSKGKIVGRPYHKFFNVGERSMDFYLEKPHSILEKLDGSMVFAVPKSDSVMWMTKAGTTDTSHRVVGWLRSDEKRRHTYTSFCSQMFAFNITPIFEWCSRKDRIVLDYPEDRLVLTALRHLHNGEYLRYDSMKVIADSVGIEVVRTLFEYDPDESPSITDFAEIVKGMADAEGVVVRFDDGHMVKIKADWYVDRHRANEGVSRPIALVRLIAEDRLDDVLPLLNAEDKADVEKFRDAIFSEIHEFAKVVAFSLRDSKEKGMSKKDYALTTKDPAHVRSMVFSMWGKDLDVSSVILIVADHVFCCSTSHRMFAEVAHFLPTAKKAQEERQHFNLEG